MKEVVFKTLPFAIESNSYHINRVRKILEQHGITAEIIGSEDAVRNRSKYHNRFIEKRMQSSYWQKEKLKERILLLLLQVDPEYKLIKKWRELKRRHL